MRALFDTINRMAERLDERIGTVVRQQNEREAMLSSMEEGVLAIDNEGTILSLNAACAELLAEDPARLQGRSIYEVIRKADLLGFVEPALAGASPVEGELLIRGMPPGQPAPSRAGGPAGAAPRGPAARAVRPLGSATAPRHDSQRGKIGVLIVLHDITRLRHLEEVRRDFVANVSHELRTPSRRSRASSGTLLTAPSTTRKTPLASCRSCSARRTGSTRSSATCSSSRGSRRAPKDN